MTSNVPKSFAKMAEIMHKPTHFSKLEAENLLRMFYKLTSVKLDRTKFRDVLHNYFNMTDDILMDRVFRAFDNDNDSYINVDEWMRGLSVFLKGTLEEKIKYCFNVYDLNSDGHITREEIFHILKNSLTKQPTEEDPDEGVKDLIDQTIRRMDYDHDGRLSLYDYKTAVEAEPVLLLQAFGTCLPSDEVREKFVKRLQTIDEAERKFRLT
ncbi:EF-hand calcium-binding domain-containing protein 1 [Trichoplax sp. H2]|nr:EF-hand calcium-binding domain-containing protein 1 [Trichoplax sp. H2]|eukprot:RDD38572.1 EF-hand calcium-binding domain-containing protein 1 [Trichoplax sp. H2]